jgi:uncharacterized cupredoxin-like copper-binding protein
MNYQSRAFAVCDEDGVVLFRGTCSEDDLSLQSSEGKYSFAVQVDEHNEYIDREFGVAMTKKTMAPSLSTEVTVDGVVATISGLPPKAKVTVNKNDTFNLEAGDTSIEFTFTEPGLYQIVCAAPTYFDSDVLEVDV